MLKRIIKSALRHTRYRIVQTGGSNRFQAIDETLQSLSARGYAPSVLIDGGANVGDFSRMSRSIFGLGLHCHLVEPQPACQPVLQQLSATSGLTLHPCAIGRTRGSLALAIDRTGVTTGAHVVPDSDRPEETANVTVETLDNLFAARLSREQRALLKLDLQGWEIEALAGGVEALRNIEVIVIEVSFFAQAYEPPISEIVSFLSGHGFELHDIASLAARRRDNRAHQADFLFVAGWSPLLNDKAWG